MFISRSIHFKVISVIFSLGIFYQFFLSQFIRQMFPISSNDVLWLGFLFCLIIFLTASRLFNTDYSTGVTKINIKFVFTSLIISLIPYSLFVLPELSHPMHFFGDEDFHLPVLMRHKDSLSRYFTTREPYPISQSLQYPSLVYGIGSLFSYSNTVAGLRAHLSFWYFLGIIIVSLSLTTLPKNFRHNIVNLGFYDF